MRAVHTVRSAEDIEACWEALHELRPHLKRDDFVARVQRQLGDGYVLAACGRTETGGFGAVMGYRILEKLECGRFMYLEDLCTAPGARKQGLAGTLVDHALAVARAEGCSCVQLDSGEQRHAAHRLYLNKGFTLQFHHFIHRLAPRG